MSPLRRMSLIHFLRDQGQPQSEWLAALSADQTLPPKADRGGSTNAPCNSLANGSRRMCILARPRLRRLDDEDKDGQEWPFYATRR